MGGGGFSWLLNGTVLELYIYLIYLIFVAATSSGERRRMFANQ